MHVVAHLPPHDEVDVLDAMGWAPVEAQHSMAWQQLNTAQASINVHASHASRHFLRQAQNTSEALCQPSTCLNRQQCLCGPGTAQSRGGVVVGQFACIHLGVSASVHKGNLVWGGNSHNVHSKHGVTPGRMTRAWPCRPVHVFIPDNACQSCLPNICHRHVQRDLGCDMVRIMCGGQA